MGDYGTGSDSSGAPFGDWQSHLAEDKMQTYCVFVNMLRAALLIIAFCLVTLVSVSFGHILPVLVGFLIILLGVLAVFVDLSGRSHFGLSLALLAIAVLFVAVSIG